jgi:hypothetical protein
MSYARVQFRAEIETMLGQYGLTIEDLPPSAEEIIADGYPYGDRGAKRTMRDLLWATVAFLLKERKIK